MPNDTPELCIDPITGYEVLYAPQRARRANALAQERLILPMHDQCPFCPGHETETPPDIYRWSASPSDPWQLRIVPNRFPAVATHDEHWLPELAASAYGQHDVMIESHRHDDDWLSMPTEHLTQVLYAIAWRIRQWSMDARSQQIQVFKNVGSRAGATLAHPHLQLIAMNYLPMRIIGELEDPVVKFAALLERVQQERLLLVQETDSEVVFCPPVSRVPYEVWVMAREQLPFTELSRQRLAELAATLQQTMRQLEAVIGKVAHNVVWRLPPRYQDHHPWRIEILPRLTTFAGLELGTGLYVNPIRPEVAAERLRDTIRTNPTI